ncbi:MAG: hypothetical protein COR54_13645 [Elusimicrobia bacterium CG22_combo_CG10-13_8_21_14_all_63_91]|nr:MAG: hypothetical protein COR54_13645 [Elusimicrobia bacterium CG22_combo_CG10-13_8_21_14_all_63_91]
MNRVTSASVTVSGPPFWEVNFAAGLIIIHLCIILNCIYMELHALPFLNRREELSRLQALSNSPRGGLAVLYGRRRVGKTRLLLEWIRRSGGLYITADRSSPEIQRRYVAEAIAARFPAFAEVAYPDWAALLSRLSREAAAAGWRGPIIFDELPYLAESSPEFAGVLQRWIDHDAREAGLTTAVAGSSQRMMHGIALAASAPLYGRAAQELALGPLPPAYLRTAFPDADAIRLVEHYTAWGGVPRYWELASAERGAVVQRVDRLLLDPLGPLHREPDRLLLEELPSAAEARPLLDAIGAGAHRLSEIAGRAGIPATSLSRPIHRLIDMGIVRREVPFGESEKKTKVSLYRIADACLRLWFRAVAPNRALLASSGAAARIAALRRVWDGLRGEAFEELCRAEWPRVADRVLRSGPFGPASRWWRGSAPEWDLVSAAQDGKTVVLGSAHFSERPLAPGRIARLADELALRAAPSLPPALRAAAIVRVLFVPAAGPGARTPAGVRLVTADALLSGQP